MDIQTTISQLQGFRQAVYQTLDARADATKEVKTQLTNRLTALLPRVEIEELEADRLGINRGRVTYGTGPLMAAFARLSEV